MYTQSPPLGAAWFIASLSIAITMSQHLVVHCPVPNHFPYYKLRAEEAVFECDLPHPLRHFANPQAS